MITVEQASNILEQAAGPVGVEDIDLHQAWGRILAGEVVSDRDQPPADRSAMDGFAVRAGDLSEPGRMLEVIGEIRAGDDPGGLSPGPGQAVRIMTGALVPAGADAVVMVERTEEDRKAGTVQILERTKPGQHIRRRGEEARAGDRLLAPGCRVRAAEMAALASVGVSRVPVFRLPRVAVLTTGDEVVEPDQEVLDHQVRNSNAVTLLAQLREIGIEGRYLGIAPDRAERLEELLQDGVRGDLLLLTGGVSMGEYDLVADALERIGTELLFHKVRVKPGKPILAGRSGSCIVLGLPGNPVSAFTGFAVFAAPLLRRIGGWTRWRNREVAARVLEPLPARPGRTTYHLVEAVFEDGNCAVRPTRTRGSGDVTSLARANAFAVTPGDPGGAPAGAVVPALLWRTPTL